ncbi:hypothetical protein GMO_24460 [Gluconobacter morbifer G707]|uniref:Uncharacterized protein n=1 Tax=Gluconobacter morbifer G707 TaxID=1088869 RepID=G6XL23_9PROT|nr:hypothetical protein GMO_24460 [Gluconobacter morbifer G707]
MPLQCATATLPAEYAQDAFRLIEFASALHPDGSLLDGE